MAERLLADKTIRKKGVIMWDGDGCQTCYAILDLQSQFEVKEGEIDATLHLRKSPEGSHILKITQK